MHGNKTARVESEVQHEADPELIAEILSLTKFVRKLKIFNSLKTLLKQQKVEAELAEEKKKQS